MVERNRILTKVKQFIDKILDQAKLIFMVVQKKTL